MEGSALRTLRIECVLKFLQEAIEIVKISVLLPKLFADPPNLRRVLEGTSYEEILKPVEDLLESHMTQSGSEPTFPIDHQTIRILDYFQKNYQIYKFFPQLMRNLSDRDRTLIASLALLLDIAKEHLYRSSKSEISKERMLHQMYHKNEDIRKRLHNVRRDLTKRRVMEKWRMAATAIYLLKIENDLAYKKWQNNVRIQNEITKCSRAMRTNHRNSLEKQKELEEQLQIAREAYAKLTQKHLLEEQDARNEKNKLLLQLQSLVKKYDANMGDVIRENLVLQDQYMVAKKELDKFMVVYRREEAVYNDIVVRREQEERRRQQQRLVVFMMNRAASKIQKYWRKWRKDQRKKNKRLKKAKKGKG
ncbi:golgin subfamily A member 6-like protein 1 [Drosophila pseudoobscura]|uniref:Dynein regulatory complex protein 10 n=1 Tax=Drosophila pseudoobscura pseudoobscura TaxID=46245 RepID=A0A6I8V3W2_DROPS|nr:golgin subfamily A member 6-like protein 1 [Drosophila pseudoobscura]